MNPFLNTAFKAARKAGQMMIRHERASFGKLG